MMRAFTLTTSWKHSGMKHEYLTMGEIFYKLSIYYDDPDFVEAVIWETIYDREMGDLEHIVFQLNKEEIEDVLHSV